MQNNESVLDPTRFPTAVNSCGWQRAAIGVVITALIFGAGGYLFGLRTGQNLSQGKQEIALQPSPLTTEKPSPIPFVPKTLYPVPTTNPMLTANWKTYTNDKHSFTFRYPSKLYTSPEILNDIQQAEGEEEVWFVTGPTPTTTTIRRQKIIAGAPTKDFKAKDSNGFFVVAIEDNLEYQFSDSILESNKKSWADFKYENIVIGGKTGRVVSGYAEDMDGQRIHWRNIDIPVAKHHLNITYAEPISVLNINEFNQILSTFKFSDQH